MKYIVAVSGGVDSVVLLDMLVNEAEHELVVAHFDHGIRADSAADARFAEALAARYGLPFEVAVAALGKGASEEQARTARYAFLRQIAQKHSGTIVTAHHQDDVVESIAINLSRGTGWRGLAVLNSPDIIRPLLRKRKEEIYEYAIAHGLEWVEDSTNASDAYLRNRIRRKLSRIGVRSQEELARLWGAQCALAASVDALSKECVTESRYALTMMDDACAIEILRTYLAQRSLALTRPQRARLLHAIKTARPGTEFEAGQGVTARFTAREFIVKHP